MHRIMMVLSEVTYKPGWRIHLNAEGKYLQVELPPDQEGTVWKGRKWLLSPHMTNGEVIQTALLAFLAAEEHEAREAFRYRGRAIFGPHLDIGKLMQISEEPVAREHADSL